MHRPPRAAAALAVLLGVACGARPAVNTHFTGTVRDAETQGPIADARIEVRDRVCKDSDDNAVCLQGFEDRVVYGPMRTQADGSFTLDPPEKAISMAWAAHPAYQEGQLAMRDSSAKESPTVNTLEFALTPRVPATPAVFGATQGAVGFSVGLGPQADGVLVLRVDAGSAAGLPEARRSYTAGERLGQATVVYVSAAPNEAPASGTNVAFTDATASATQAHDFVVYGVTGIGVYSAQPATLRWTP